MKLILSALLVHLAWIGAAHGLDLYIVRHAETMGNVTGDYSEENQRTFSPKGLEQIGKLPDKLAPLHVDAVLVSPAWRTQKTILPYLKKTGLKAEIVPEITECDCGISGKETPAADPARGAPVELVEDGREWIAVEQENLPAQYALSDKEEGLAVLLKGVAIILTRYSQTTNSILLVTHSCTGSRLIELLLGKDPKGSLAPGNAAVTHLRQQPDGRFELLTFNDETLTPLRKAMMFGFQPGMLPGFLDLAGAWKIISGDNPAYAQPDTDDSAFLTTQVPGGWEADALTNYDGLAWYRLTFTVPEERRAEWAGKPLVLFMGAIDDADQTFLNGQMIGSTGEFSPAKVTAWDKPRVYSLNTEALHATNILAIRVDDWGGGGGLWRGPAAIGPADVLNELFAPAKTP